MGVPEHCQRNLISFMLVLCCGGEHMIANMSLSDSAVFAANKISYYVLILQQFVLY
jgi:hypothetical protein